MSDIAGAEPGGMEDLPAPDGLEMQVRELEDKLAEAERQAKENREQFLRARADLENYRKRVERDIAQLVRMGKKDLLLGVLEVVDNLERALSLAGEGSPEALRSGVEITYRQLLKVLADAGVTPVEAVGNAFDPSLHEALSVWESDEVGEEKVTDEIQKGYLFEGEVLRPARVRVVRPKSRDEPIQ